MCSKKEECWTLILYHQVAYPLLLVLTGNMRLLEVLVLFCVRLIFVCCAEWRGSQSELEKAEESQNGRPEMGKMEETPAVVPMQVTCTNSLKSPVEKVLIQ